MINLTERAIKEVKKFMEEGGSSPETHVLRVGAIAGGCSGYSYKLELEERSKVDGLNDHMLQFEGITAVIDNKSILLLEGTEIDFYEGLDARGFKFANPQSKRSCGCEKSFSV